MYSGAPYIRVPVREASMVTVSSVLKERSSPSTAERSSSTPMPKSASRGCTLPSPASSMKMFEGFTSL